VPIQPELAMGAVVDGAEAHVVRNEDVIRLADISEEEFTAVRDRELLEDRTPALEIPRKPCPRRCRRTGGDRRR
jgi:predicted phosphoribosyltransferase